MENEMMSVPVVALRNMTVLPGQVLHFDVSREKSLQAIEQAIKEGQLVFLTAQRDMESDEPGANEVYRTGCVAQIRQIVRLPKKVSRVLVSGEKRARIVYLAEDMPYLRADIEVIEEGPEQEADAMSEEALEKAAMLRGMKDLFKEYMGKKPKTTRELAAQIEAAQSVGKLADMVAASLSLPYKDIQKVLEETNVRKRYELVAFKTMEQIRTISFREDLQAKMKERVDKRQREYILREELKLIREELGEDNVLTEAEEFEQAAEKLSAPEEVKEKLKKEIRRFKNSANSSAESGVLHTYIETLLEMPWDVMCEENEDIQSAKEMLDEDHYGLEKVKERILEFLAVRVLTKKGDTPILCLVGPPGTGKTSIAKSLAGALERPYVRISLGGVRDEAEIRGHRKTYVGAMPGRIANALKYAGVKNPLMLLDEIDKVSNDYKGDTFSALLEVLDSEQNVKFRDHYLEVPLDLSEVLFVTTANTLQTIPKPLLDRMEVIEISSYTENEKLHIAEEHLAPKQLERHGLKKKQLTFSRNAIWKMARNYTKEAGVRQLERKIGDVCRKAAREILEKKKKSIQVTERNLHLYLGKEPYTYQMANAASEVGIVRGLAWTSVGGDTLQIEVNIMAGEGEVLLTGQMGDVMKESAKTGISYIRSAGKAHHIEEDFFKKHDIHIHIPEGAVPKDGPSAGITMATAMLSAVTEKKVRADVAMTGEITLRGRVLRIGGLKEKLLAAKNAGIKTVLIPRENEADVEEIAAEITKGLEIIPVPCMDEVLDIALVRGGE